MKDSNSVNWNSLLDDDFVVANVVENWSEGNFSTREVTDLLKNSGKAGEFRKLVRKNGTVYGRNLARKAISYRTCVR